MRSRVLSIGALTVGILAAAAPGCQYATNSTAVQCTSEAECLALGPSFAETTCDKVTKTCVKAEPEIGKCASNQECLQQTGQPSICRKSDKRCVVLTTPECPTVLSETGNAGLANDDTVVVGLMTPEGVGEIGTMLPKVSDLALSEINGSFQKGLPPVPGSQKPRPLAIVSCREFADGVEGLVRQTEHLVKNVQVPLVIGPTDSGNSGIAASQVTNPNKVLMLTVGPATLLASTPNPIAPTPLIWRIALDDRAVAVGSEQFIKHQLEPALQARGINPPYRVGHIYSADPVGISTQQQFEKYLKFNGKDVATNFNDGNWLSINAGDTIDSLNNPNPDAQISAAVAAMIKFEPHIVLHSYTGRIIMRAFPPFETLWPANKFRPYQIGTQGYWNALPPFVSFLNGRSTAPPIRLNGRFFAVQGFASDTAPPFPPLSPEVTGFASRLQGKFPDINLAPARTQTIWYGYDLVYMAAYAIAALRDKPVTGENLAQTLPLLTAGAGGTLVKTYDNADISKAFGELSAGRSISLQGLSGSLNLDKAIAAPTYSIEITCGNIDATSKQPAGMKGSGFHYSPDTQASTIRQGSTDAPPTSPLLGSVCPPPPPPLAP